MAKALDKYTLKRDAILVAAEALFLTLGYEKTTMDMVATRAEVTKQTVYRYFSSKIDLFAALLQKDKDEEGSFEFRNGDVLGELNRYALAFVSSHMTNHRIQMYRLMLCESGKHKELGELFVSLAQSKWKSVLISYFTLRLRLENAEFYVSMFSALLLHLRSSIIMGLKDIPSERMLREETKTAVSIFYKGFIQELE
jgi:AcrR family transcriptional regulator